MLPFRVDPSVITFAEPQFLWLLTVPALATGAWVWRAVRRRADLKRLARRRLIPVTERYALVGDLPFWLTLLVASALLVVAMARPSGTATTVRNGGIDVVVLQDGSASMMVKDVPGSRWQRSIGFLRILGDSLNWTKDRIALALFAHVAVPQIRLTRDPNTFFFFLDHLDQASPFNIDQETTWDTDLELGLRWGIRLAERDEELHGRSPNARMFVLISDGESWSGEIANSLRQAVARSIPVYVVGAGSLAGGRLPDFHDDHGKLVVDPDVPTVSRLDRTSLERIALAGGGQYFELERDGDRRIANALVDAGRRMAPSPSGTANTQELYWPFIATAAILPFIGLLFLRDRSELWLQMAGAIVITIVIVAIL